MDPHSNGRRPPRPTATTCPIFAAHLHAYTLSQCAAAAAGLLAAVLTRVEPQAPRRRGSAAAPPLPLTLSHAERQDMRRTIDAARAAAAEWTAAAPFLSDDPEEIDP